MSALNVFNIQHQNAKSTSLIRRSLLRQITENQQKRLTERESPTKIRHVAF